MTRSQWPGWKHRTTTTRSQASFLFLFNGTILPIHIYFVPFSLCYPFITSSFLINNSTEKRGSCMYIEFVSASVFSYSCTYCLSTKQWTPATSCSTLAVHFFRGRIRERKILFVIRFRRSTFFSLSSSNMTSHFSWLSLAL